MQQSRAHKVHEKQNGGGYMSRVRRSIITPMYFNGMADMIITRDKGTNAAT